VRTISVLTILLFAALMGGAGQAGIHGSALGSCPNGNSYADGCAGANQSALFQHANFFTGYAQQTTGAKTAYDIRPPWNVAGVDYPVGAYTPLASLQDPATASPGVGFGKIPTGCTYYPNGSTPNGTHGPLFYCTGISSSFTISGFAFGPSSAWPSSGHDCIVLQFSATVTATHTVTDNQFDLGGACSVGSSGTGTVYYPGLIYDISPSNLVVVNNTFYGHWWEADAHCPAIGAVPFPCQQGLSGPSSYGMSPISTGANANVANVTIQYNAIVGFTGHCWFLNAATANTVDDLRFNYCEGWENRAGGGHGEAHYGSGAQLGGSQLVKIEFNTFLQPSGAGSFTTSTIQTDATSGGYIQSFLAENNVIVTNNAAGLAAATMTVGYVVDDGNGTFAGSAYTGSGVAGQILTVTASTANPGPDIGSAVGNNFGLVAYLGTTVNAGAEAEGQVGAQYSIDCGGSNGGYGCTGIGYGLNSTISHNFTSQTATTSTSDYYGGLRHDHSTITGDPGSGQGLIISGNYLDMTGAGYPTTPWQTQSDGACSFPASFSGNVDMTSNTARNSWSGATSNGC
jgi:hypothetical protein